MEEKELEEKLEEKNNDIRDINEEILKCYKKILKYKLMGPKELIVKEFKKLKLLLKKESLLYKNMNKEELAILLERVNLGELRCINTNLDKFYSIAFQYYSLEDEKSYRLLNNLRDSFILANKLSRFDDEDVFEDIETQDYEEEYEKDYDYEYDYEEENEQEYDYDYEEEYEPQIEQKQEFLHNYTKEYENKLLNNLIIEYQLFEDLLTMFICAINEQLQTIEDKSLCEQLQNYKNVILYTYGKNNIKLIDDNLDFDNSYIQSKFLYDMLLASDRCVSYNYEIIKLDYLDKALFTFFKDIYSIKGYTNANLEKVIQACYLKAMLMVYANNYDRAVSIFNSCRKDNYKCEHIDNIFENVKNTANKAKVLTLNK